MSTSPDVIAQLNAKFASDPNFQAIIHGPTQRTSSFGSAGERLAKAGAYLKQQGITIPDDLRWTGDFKFEKKPSKWKTAAEIAFAIGAPIAAPYVIGAMAGGGAAGGASAAGGGAGTAAGGAGAAAGTASTLGKIMTYGSLANSGVQAATGLYAAHQQGNAADAQLKSTQDANNKAAEEARRQYDIQRQDWQAREARMAPYRNLGANAAATLGNMMTIPNPSGPPSGMPHPQGPDVRYDPQTGTLVRFDPLTGKKTPVERATLGSLAGRV